MGRRPRIISASMPIRDIDLLNAQAHRCNNIHSRTAETTGLLDATPSPIPRPRAVVRALIMTPVVSPAYPQMYRQPSGRFPQRMSGGPGRVRSGGSGSVGRDASSPGETIGPPAEKLYAVEPVEDATINASAEYEGDP